MPSFAQRYVSTPVDLDPYWNMDAWYHFEDGNPDAQGQGADPAQPSNHPDAAGAIWSLDSGTNARIRISTLPEGVIPGELNWTEDQEIQFLLPAMEIGDLDGYYVTGDVIDVPNGNYQWLFLAMMSGSGNWPGNANQWGPVTDLDTGEVLDPRSEVNSFKPIYEDGEGDWIPIGLVNDWFWQVPEWVAPASGDPNEIIADFLTYEGDEEGFFYLYDWNNVQNHDFGQYYFVNAAEEFFTYRIENVQGLTGGTLWTEMWGNIRMSISTDNENWTVLYDSSTEDQVYTAPAGNIDGFSPNRELRSFDITPHVDGNQEFIYLKMENPVPDNAAGEENNPWGPRLHRLGIFTGDTVISRLGDRLWPGLVRTDGNSPEGGLILIKKQYRLDETRVLDSIQMPNNLPRNTPILTVFGMTLANVSDTAVQDYFLY
ncbi:MAG: hypothetical protein ACOX5R_10580 [bacterium]